MLEEFPNTLRVQVRDDAQALPNMLVWVNTRVWGQDYYRGHVGITNTSGVAVLTREDLVQQFREDQKLFPMDYKIVARRLRRRDRCWYRGWVLSLPTIGRSR